MNKISFAVIGGGPAAFYISKLLPKLSCQPLVDIYQKQLCPFGLLRYGVAPDHISIKKSEVTLSEAANYPNFRYFGNYFINQNNIQELKSKYSGIIYAYGASQNHLPKWLKDTSLMQNSNIKFARDIVYWYNSHPDKQNSRQNLEKIKNVVIVGNGNVAIDISRIFLRNTKQLENTQISINALEQLKNTNIQNIQILGRRGVTHSAFAVKQIRQLHKCKIKLYAIQQQLQESMTVASQKQCTAIGDHFSSVVRMNKRKVDFIRQSFTIIQQKDIQKQKQKPFKKIFLRYLIDPKKVENNILTCDRTALSGQAFKQKAHPTGKQIKLNFDLLVISTGFQVAPIDQDHFDITNKKIHNSDGCVLNKSGKVDIGNYAVGWCKTGPKGVIDQTLLSCEQTLNNLRIHIQNGLLETKPRVQQPEGIVPFQKYEQVRQIELSRGNKQKFIKKKMSNRQLIQFLGINETAKHNIIL